MKIGVIGTGKIGSTIARRSRALGHSVYITNSRGAEGARAAANDTGATPVDLKNAVDGMDLIVLSIPFTAAADLPSSLFADVPSSVAIIDTSNYYPEMRDPQIPPVDAGQVESVWVAEQIGHSVIKAFNNIISSSFDELGLPSGWADRLAIAVAGDDPEQKKTVMDLVDAFGFDPVDGGTLDESWRQQPATPGSCCDYGADRMRKGMSQAVKDKTPMVRANLRTLFPMLGSSPHHDDLIAMNRFLNPVR